MPFFSIIYIHKKLKIEQVFTKENEITLSDIPLLNSLARVKESRLCGGCFLSAECDINMSFISS